MTVALVPADPQLAGMFRLELHDAVFRGLVDSGAIVDGYLDPERLERWADGCDNPTGQRATLCRAIAHLRRLGPLVLEGPAARAEPA